MVGVGGSVSGEEMESVASQPWNDFTFLARDADDLESTAEKLATSICNRKSVLRCI